MKGAGEGQAERSRPFPTKGKRDGQDRPLQREQDKGKGGADNGHRGTRDNDTQCPWVQCGGMLHEESSLYDKANDNSSAKSCQYK